MGEKSGWTYIDVPLDVSQSLNPDIKTSYRVKGKIDQHAIAQVSLVPMGDGHFIIAINGTMRKAIRKEEGAMVTLTLERDTSELTISEDLMGCLLEEPTAWESFNNLPKSHQRYYSNWIESAKTIETKTKRIHQTIFGLSHGMEYGEMIRHFKTKKESQ